jgi:hypothetical protein
MMTTSRLYKWVAVAVALLLTVVSVRGGDKPGKVVVPGYTLSPNHRYGVTVPILIG